MKNWVDYITAAATCAMFWIGWLSYKLAKQVQDQAEQQQKDFSDLLEAIVISNLLSGPSSTGNFGNVMQAFKQHYKGKRQILK